MGLARPGAEGRPEQPPRRFARCRRALQASGLISREPGKKKVTLMKAVRRTIRFWLGVRAQQEVAGGPGERW